MSFLHIMISNTFVLLVAVTFVLLFLGSAASQTDAAKKDSDSELLNAPKVPDIPNIDADIEDPQLCSFYAADIYDNLRIAEVCVVNALSLLCIPISLYVEITRIYSAFN
jgi:hypothetical protein